MRLIHSSWIGAMLLILSLVPASAQEEGAAGTAPDMSKPFAEQELIPVDQLQLTVKPMTVDELNVEVAAWLACVTRKAKGLSDKKIGQTAAEGEAKTKLVEEAFQLGLEQDAYVARLNVVLASLEAKGGDVEAHRKYVVAATALDIDTDIKNVSAFFTTITQWLKSDEGGIKWAKNIGAFLVILIAFWFLSRFLAKVTNRAVGGIKNTSDLLRTFFVNTVRKVTILVGLIIALGEIGIDIGPLVMGLGAISFVVAFALQGTLSNFACGIMILLYRPFDVGDAVEVAGVSGSVEAMTLVSTTIKSWDNQRIVVPNNSIWGGIITNITGNKTRRVDMVFGIGYDDDIAKAQGILEDILSNNDLVLADPAFVIKVHELADSSVNFIVRPWAKTADYWTVYWDVTRAVKERFDAEGVSIPYPQQDVHMHQVSPA